LPDRRKAEAREKLMERLALLLSNYAAGLHWYDYVGYVASIFVALSFYMKTIIPLRLLALCSNVTFILYGFFGNLPPVFFLHVFLLPLNIIRVVQMKNLIKKVREVASKDYSFEWLVPYMSKRTYKEGEVLFRKGDAADQMFYIQKGVLRLEEIAREARPGDLIGEMGIFSPYKERTSTGVCEEELEAYCINDEKIIELYYQNPSFGLYLIQLVTKRFVENYVRGVT
jgi:CRP/FNR family cyclic AMP-dependent transcriptional regulator